MTTNLKFVSSDLQTSEMRHFDAVSLGARTPSEEHADMRLIATLSTKHMDQLIRAIVAVVESIEGVSIQTDVNMQRLLAKQSRRK